MNVPGEGCILLFIYGCLIFNVGFVWTKEYVADDDGARRNGKAFSLFSVVTFKNDECSSESTFAGGAVKGTCYSATECSDKSGTKSGNCASGFGVCCVFISNIGTATIKENRTYLQSLLFPAIETSTTAITYTLNKMQTDICQIRLDFDFFAIAGPTNSDEVRTGTTYTGCADALTTTLTSNAIVPILCGTMTGSHIYLDVGMDATDTATLAMTFATTPTRAIAMSSWRIKTSQIPCWAPYRAPDGCHQYFYGSPFGQIWSPNFRTGPSTVAPTLGGANYKVDLLGLDLKICMRREKGMCCTLYQVCNYDPDGEELTEAGVGGAVAEGTGDNASPGWSFSMDCWGADAGGTLAKQSEGIGMIDENCTNDYVEIPDSATGLKNYGFATQVNSRYCCNRFGFIPGVTTAAGTFNHAPIWDCTEPFEVLYHTDIYTDDIKIATDADDSVDIVARGMCLLYKQEAC